VATSRKIIAVSVAVILFMMLHYSLTLGSNYLANNSSDFTIWQPGLIFTAYILYLLSGITASIISKEQFVVIGALAGLVSAISAVLSFGVGGEAIDVAFTLVWGLVLGGLGGSLSAWFKNRVANAL